MSLSAGSSSPSGPAGSGADPHVALETISVKGRRTSRDGERVSSRSHKNQIAADIFADILSESNADEVQVKARTKRKQRTSDTFFHRECKLTPARARAVHARGLTRGRPEEGSAGFSLAVIDLPS